MPHFSLSVLKMLQANIWYRGWQGEENKKKKRERENIYRIQNKLFSAFWSYSQKWHFILQLLLPHILSDIKLFPVSMYKGDLGPIPSSMGPFLYQQQPREWDTMHGSQVGLQENVKNWISMDCDLPGSSVLGISHQEYWSGLQFPSSGYLPDPGIKLRSPALGGRFFTTEPPGKPITRCIRKQNKNVA